MSGINTKRVAIIGGGPAGLMAAEVLSGQGVQVDVYDAMPSVGRKFLLAGRGGLNLTHSEPTDKFLARFGERGADVGTWLQIFDAQAVRDWAAALGIATFVGTSGRVFPEAMKAAPLLRAWLNRLRATGVTFHMRHRWLGWQGGPAGPGHLRFATPAGELTAQADALLLALGGGSWGRLGSDGAWVPELQARGVDMAALRAANCGFDVGWSEHFRQRYAGQPVKSVAISRSAPGGEPLSRQGEFIVTQSGIEGSLVYAFAAGLRDEIESQGQARLFLDLMPGWSAQRVLQEVTHPRGARSMSSHLQSRLKLTGVKAGLLRECAAAEAFQDPCRLSALIKALPLQVLRPRPIDEAISSAGGVRFQALSAHLMLKALPGVFCAGEMIDWEAPTGGYLLTACMASGVAAARGIAAELPGLAGVQAA